MFILKGVKVVCFDALLEVLILKVVRRVVVSEQRVVKSGRSRVIGRSFELPVAGESAAGFGGNQDVPVGGGAEAWWHRRWSWRRW